MTILGNFLYSQLFATLPVPSVDLTGQTIIVTGSNVGLGLEAARHISRLGASTLILAVRTVEKGEAAKASILASTSRPASSIQVWPLDLSSHASVKAFAARAIKELPRLDALLENAGIATDIFRLTDGAESTITTNVISTLLLGLLLLPKLRATAKEHNTTPRLTIVASEVHFFTSFPEKSAPQGQLLASLSDKDAARMGDRYNVSKLLEVFFVRELAARLGPDSPVVVNCLNPGLCHSELGRNAGWTLWALKQALARTTEAGSRTLVHGACVAGKESHGAYLSDCNVTDPAPLVRSEEGKALQPRIWEELVGVVEGIQKGVVKGAGL